jgi:hypothetical protein
MTTERSSYFQSVAAKWETRLQRYATKHPHRWIVFVVMIAVTTSLFSKYPAYNDVHVKFPGSFVGFSTTPTGRATEWWLDHPFRPLPIRTFFPEEALRDPMLAGAASHSDKLTFRAFLPLLNQVTRGGVWTLVVANHVATIASFWLIYLICFRAAQDPVLAAIVVWTYAATWSGTWGFNDLMFGDAVAITLLLAAMVTRPWWIVSILFLAAGFTDERAFAAAPAITLYCYWKIHPPFSVQSASRVAALKAACAPLLSAAAVYAACRLSISYLFNVHSGTSMMGTTEIALYHFYVSYPGKLFKVFEFLWAFPLLLIVRFVTSAAETRRAALLYLACISCAMAPSFLVWDLDRSLCYVLPAVLVSVCLWQGESVQRRRIALCVCLASLLWLEPNTSFLRYLVFS